MVWVAGPEGSTMLINGGTSVNTLSGLLGSRLSPVSRRIDAMIEAECRAKSAQILPVILNRYEVSEAGWGCSPDSTPAGLNLARAYQERGIVSRVLRSGDKMVLGETMVAEVLSSNGEGSALLLHWRDFRMLIPGGLPIASHPDNPAPTLLLLTSADLEAASLADWQAAFSPALILSPAAIPPGGWVHVRTDGRQMWVEQGK